MASRGVGGIIGHSSLIQPLHLIGVTRSSEYVLASCGNSVMANSKAGDIWSCKEQTKYRWANNSIRMQAVANSESGLIRIVQGLILQGYGF